MIPEAEVARRRSEDRRSAVTGCMVLALAVLLAIGVLEFLVFLVALAWHGARAVFS